MVMQYHELEFHAKKPTISQGQGHSKGDSLKNDFFDPYLKN